MIPPKKPFTMNSLQKSVDLRKGNSKDILCTKAVNDGEAKNAAIGKYHPTFVSTSFAFLTVSVIPSSVGPLSLVGGTAAIYTSLLQHPSSSLTQLSFVFMMLLATQYALQPRLSRKYISPKIDKQSVALVEEVVKTCMAAAIFVAKPAAEVQSALKGL
jgi:hypothetical protein